VLRQPGEATPGRVVGARLVVTGAVLTVLAQVAYPLTSGDALRWLTISTVVLFAATGVAHAWLTRGPAWAMALTVMATGGGLLVEGVGLRTGWPFGEYAYAGTLGPEVGGVPAVVPLAWLMMAYPCLVLGRTVAARLEVARRSHRSSRRSGSGARGALTVALLGGYALAAWDVLLDPQMVAAGHWTWHDPQPGLPGTTGVPISNAVGWLLAGIALMALLHVVLPSGRRSHGTHDGHVGLTDAVPGALLGWTWLGSTLANAVFFDRPGVAAWGGAARGAAVLPNLLVLWGRRP
jgi:putative membrane protein